MYACEACGYRTSKWMGFCPQCRGGEELRPAPAVPIGRRPAATPVPIGAAAGAEATRTATGIDEIDRVLGGGLVAGAAILVGGEPGVGKSTLLLQAAAGLARSGSTALVVSAEESERQVGIRAGRLGIDDEGVFVLAESDVDAVLAAAVDLRPGMLVVDSVQTVSTSGVEGSAGGTGQVRECGARLVGFAKEHGIPVVIVGHVTKDGSIAGPKLLEHMVDVVLYLEGDDHRDLRFLRSLKNRFGPAHEVGLFEMRSSGLEGVADASAALVGNWAGGVAGTVLFPAMEGRRPMLVEIQALVARSATPQPRRSVKGLDIARVHQVLAVLERHAGLSFGDREVYVSAVGGARIREPASDLPVALALASSLAGEPLGSVAAWGEVGLTGEVRPVPQGARRRREAERLGVATTLTGGDGGVATIGAALAVAGLAAPAGRDGRRRSHLEGL
jgi:DNA repair protein RadA/Sms